MKKLLVLALLFAVAGIFSQGARAQTPSCTMSPCTAAGTDATSLIDALPASNATGAFVVNVPTGTATWTTGNYNYTIPSGVTSLTIQGNTTVICTGTAGTSSYACTATDNSVIVDAYAVENTPLLNINVGTATFRMTGLSFEGGNVGTSIGKPNGFMTISANTTSFRVDHCDLNASTYTGTNSMSGITIYGEAYGVIDHTIYDADGEGNGFRYYQGPSEGDTTWNQASQWGTGNFLFLENNIFHWGAANDCDYGCRMVIRYNTFISSPYDNDTGLWQAHQVNQGDPRKRGGRALEVYGNYFNGSTTDPAFSAGGGAGTGLVWGNTFAGGYNYDLNFWDAREAATGHTASDAPNGFGYCGTASDGVASPWDGNSDSLGYPCLDQTGRGQGDLVSGSTFPGVSNSTNGCPGASLCSAWPHQLLEPWYVWNETMPSNGAGYKALILAQTWNNMAPVNNRDFYYQCGSQNSSCSTFNGTAGVGTGTLAPTNGSAYSGAPNCTPGAGGTFGKSPTGSYGVGYWDSANSTLYVCTAANTWTAIYTPYVYPHPLVSGGSPLSAPSVSPGNGSYTSPQTVTITGPAGAAICYRTDGNAPTASTPGTCDAGSTTYSGPFSLAIPGTGAIVEAIATQSGQIDSTVATASYTLQTCLNTPLGGNWTCVADASNSTGSSVTSLTAGPMAVNPPAGSLVVVFQWELSNAICVTPTDTLGTSFTSTGYSSASVSAISMQLCDWYGVVGAGGAQESVTCNVAATAAGMACMAVDVSGQASSGIVDQTCERANGVSASGINNMNCANSITVSQPNELVLAAAFGDDGTRTAGTNFTMIDALNWTGEYFMEATPTIWTPSETISASGLNYGFLALTLKPYNLVQTPRAPTGLAAVQ